MIKNPLFPLFLLCFLLVSFTLPVQACLARENVNYWYIQDFYAKFEVQPDSTLLVTENITADCGNAVDKHGIFRILPEQIRTTAGTIETPVKLVSITDFNGQKIDYSSSADFFNKTVTWKVGNPNITVHGVNTYKIVYQVKNAVRHEDGALDEFYWNLNGAFWDLQIDTFTADIVFPAGINKDNSQIDYYAGLLGSKDKGNVTYEWLGGNILRFKSANLKEREGITASITFPKGIIQPYEPSFFEKYGLYFLLLLPIIAFIICFKIWHRYGRDPKADKTVIAEYEPPAGLSPIQLGTVYFGRLNNEHVSAGIVNLATHGYLQIQEVEKTSVLSSKDYKLIKSQPKKEVVLCPTTKLLYEKLFGAGEEVLLSSLKNKFYEHVSSMHTVARREAIDNGYIYKKGSRNIALMIGAGAILSILAGLAWQFYLPLAWTLFVCAGITIIFATFMGKVTEKGAELIWQIKGFKLYMETAEKYRLQFAEKENIFEKLLPYAMVFGMTKVWINKMKQIYGEDYFNRYHPAWFAGAALTSFDTDSFNSAVSNLSSAIASNISAPSGAGGGGSSGGGGGGGGGGGW